MRRPVLAEQLENIPNAVNLSQSVVSVPAPGAEIQAGDSVKLMLTTKDTDGNQEPGGGLTVQFGVNNGSGIGALATPPRTASVPTRDVKRQRDRYVQRRH